MGHKVDYNDDLGRNNDPLEDIVRSDGNDAQMLFNAECEGKIIFIGTACNPVARAIYESGVRQKKMMKLGLALLAGTIISAGIAYVCEQESVPSGSTAPVENNATYENFEKDR